MSVLADVVAGVLMLSGSLLALAAGVGMVRFGDLWTRMHAGTKPQVLGLVLVLAGVQVHLLPDLSAVVSLALVALFQLVTSPVAGHLLARAGHRSGSVSRAALVRDDLARDEGLATARGEREQAPPR